MIVAGAATLLAFKTTSAVLFAFKATGVALWAALWSATVPTASAVRDSQPAMSIDIAVSVNLGGAAAVAPGSVPAKKFKFMHIPKTGGTSIDGQNLYLDRCDRAFESLMSDTYDRICDAHPDILADYEFNEGKLFQVSHLHRQSYHDFMLKHYELYPWASMPDGEHCEGIHAPPSVPAYAKYFEDSSSVFCVVRNPLHKFYSAYQMQQIGPCEGEGLEIATRQLLENLTQTPYMNTCMFIPQIEMVYGVRSLANATKKYCTEILHTEHLDEEFAALMQRHNIGLRLPKREQMTPKKWGDQCRVDTANLSTALKKMIYDVYRDDFEAFGYSPPV